MAEINAPLGDDVGKTAGGLIGTIAYVAFSNWKQAVATRGQWPPLRNAHLMSSVSVSSPLVQTTDSFSDSITSLASHLSLRTLPAFRCLSLETMRPESSLIVRIGAATQYGTTRVQQSLRSQLAASFGHVIHEIVRARAQQFEFYNSNDDFNQRAR